MWKSTLYYIHDLQLFSPIQMAAFLFSLVVSLAVQKDSSLMLLRLPIFDYVPCVFGVISTKSLQSPMSRKFSPMFSSRSFTVYSRTFKSLMHFMLIFVYSIRVQFLSFTCVHPGFPVPLLKRLSFPHSLSLIS